MGKPSFLQGVFVGAGILIGLLVLLFLAIPEIYLFTENRNFAALREKSKLDCSVTPLHCLVRDRKVDEIAKYVNAGRKLELKDNWGRTAAFYALWNGETELLSELLASGADVDAKDENGISMFYQAVAWGRYGVADQLLAYGADIDMFNGSRYPETALHFCVMKNRPDCVRYLIERGANTGLKDGFGYTVYERVRMHDHVDPQIGKLLEK